MNLRDDELDIYTVTPTTHELGRRAGRRHRRLDARRFSDAKAMAENARELRRCVNGGGRTAYGCPTNPTAKLRLVAPAKVCGLLCAIQVAGGILG